MYTYKAKVVSIYDADTITVDIDLGFSVVLRSIKVRLYGLNAPELKGATRSAGIRARDALRARLLNQEIVIETIKDEQEKYGRWLGIVNLNGENLNNWLVNSGFAVEYYP